MKKRKTIAVVAADVFNEYMNRIFVGISEQCRALGYDAVTFLMAFNMESGSLIQQGEENIFTLIRKDVIDGVILMAGNNASQNLVEKFEKVFSRWGIPVIAVDYDLDFCESIYAEDVELMAEMTDHLIEKHGCRHIMCLTGPEGSPPAMSRLEGYRLSMERHGLEIHEGDIVYGDFWKIISQRLAKHFIENRDELPDAVVCANDVMARHLCDSVIKGGIKVPEELKIAGYDAAGEAVMQIPSLATVFPENGRLGARAVCRLHKLITGEDTEPVDTLKRGHLVFAKSCGCGSNVNYALAKREEQSNLIDRFNSYYNKSAMLERLMEEKNLDGLLRKLNGFAYTINGLDAYFLCLCKNWDNVEEEDNEYIREGYAPVMENKFIYTRNRAEFVNREFPSEDILPDFIDEYCSEPSMYFLLPLHFMDRCFGYSVFRFNDVRKAVSSVFARWNRNISISLEFLRVRTKLTSINQRILMSSIRDTLTGIYNRKGFNRLSEGIFKRARDEGKPLFVMMADLDQLKMINDNFGHMEGDNAITVAANALQTSCQLNEVCARIGGDEYAIVGCGDYSDEHISEHMEAVRSYFDRYNASSGRKYEVGLSLGYFLGVPDKDSELDRYINIADEMMYKDKVRRKKLREN